jgi:hypothetical protein
MFSRVIEDHGKIELHVGDSDLSVLESDDAVHFRNTGIKIPCYSDGLPTILVDPHDSAECRYKLFTTQSYPNSKPPKATTREIPRA